MTPADRVEPPTVHLHIGTMKTGTSYLQHVLDHQADELARQGIRYPGSTGRAVNDVLERRGTATLGDTAGAWHDLVADVRSWHGSGYLVSMEFLALATTAQIERIVTSLAPSRVTAVLTMRDLARTIPSAWQQTTKNRGTAPWPVFLDLVLATATPAPRVAQRSGAVDLEPGRQFWRHHDAVRIAGRWADVIGASNVTVVLVPPRESPPELLWQRFGLATGIDTARVPAVGAGRGNPSLGHAEADLLRRLNDRLAGALKQDAYRRLVTGTLARRVLRSPAGGATPPAPLPEHAHEWARDRGRALQVELVALGVKVVGELAELVPTERARPAEPASAARDPLAIVEHADVARLAVSATAALLADLAETTAAERRRPRSPRRSR